MGQIGGGGEQPGMAGDAAHVPRRGIMHDAAKRLYRHHLGRGDAVELGSRRQISGVSHSERLKKLTRDEFFERTLTHALDHFSKEKEIDVAVPKSGAWRIEELFFASFLNCSLLALPLGFCLDVPAQSGSVRHQLANGNRFFALAMKFGDVGLD